MKIYYELVSRGLVNLGHMLDNEAWNSKLKEKISHLKDDFQRILCHMFIYFYEGHDSHPVDDDIHGNLTDVKNNPVPRNMRNQYNKMLVRDLLTLFLHLSEFAWAQVESPLDAASWRDQWSPAQLGDCVGLGLVYNYSRVCLYYIAV